MPMPPKRHELQYRLNSDIFRRVTDNELEDLLRIKRYIECHYHTAFILNHGNFVQEILVRKMTLDIEKRKLHIEFDDGGHDRHFDVVNIVNSDNVTVCCLYYVYEQYMKNYGSFDINIKI